MNAFTPGRLTDARVEMGFTMSDLAEKADVSRVTISQLEKGLCTPQAETLAKLCWVLKKDTGYFYPEIEVRYTDITEVAFRNYATTSKKLNNRAIVKKRHIQDLVQLIFDNIKNRPLNIPVNLIPEDPASLDDEDIEKIASDLRAYWNLGDGNVKNLATILENNGIICVSTELPEKIDSLTSSFRLDGHVNNIILYDSESSYFRQRFDLAHELGHIMLHFYLEANVIKKDSKKWENQANRFASAFLMPYEAFSSTVYGTSIRALLNLKQRWDVSINSIIYRLHDLGIIDDIRNKSLNIEISRKGWKKEEPYDSETPRERGYFLNQATNFIIDNGLATPVFFSKYTGLLYDELYEYTNSRYFFKQAEKPNLNWVARLSNSN